MGDVIHNLPIVGDICTAIPDAQIDWVVEEPFAEIPRLHARVQQIIPVAFRRWRSRLLSKSTWRDLRRLKQQLQATRYDVVLDSQGLLKSAWVTARARGSKCGYDWRSAREPLASRFYDQRFFVSKDQHAVRRNRALAARALGYPIPNDTPDYGLRGIAMSVANGTTSMLPTILDLKPPYVVCLHATSRARKHWPEEYWQQLLRHLVHAGITPVLPWGNAHEEVRARCLARDVPKAWVLPRLGLTQLAEVMTNARAVVGVDTGLVHLAVALDRPTVALYTDTNPHLTGLLGRDRRYAINLGHAQTIPTVAEVIAALDAMQVCQP